MQSEVSRRTLLKSVGTAAGVATAGGLGVTTGKIPVERASAAACGGICVGTAVAGGVALGILAKKGYDAYLGDDKDYSGYTGADALHSSVYEGAMQLGSANERVMTSVNNNISNSKNVALSKAKAAVIESMNAGESQTAANSAMEAEIDSYYTTVQKNMLNHWHAQIGQYLHYFQSVKNHSSLSTTSVFNTGGNPLTSASLYTGTATLIDGTNVEYKGIDQTSESSGSKSLDPLATLSIGSTYRHFRVYDPTDASNEFTANIGYWADGTGPNETGPAWNKLIWERDNVYSQVSGFVSDVYSQWDAGDIPTEELVDPITAATELQQDYDGYQTQGAQAAMLGIPTSAEQSLYLHLKSDDKYVWADIYTEYVPTQDGEEIGFKVGNTYQPSNWSKPLYIAFEYTDDSGNKSSDFIQIEQDFSIEEGQDQDGQEIDKFQTKSQNNQTSDVASIEEELAQVREMQLQMQQEAQSGGAGGSDFSLGQFSIGPVPGIAVAGGLGAVILAAVSR